MGRRNDVIARAREDVFKCSTDNIAVAMDVIIAKDNSERMLKFFHVFAFARGGTVARR